AYQKTGNTAKANAMRSELDTKYAENKFQKQIYNAVTGADKKQKQKVTEEYEKVYNLFIEGKFDEALAEKKIADSLYGTSYWTPQLLYIESIYHVHAKQDAEAIRSLNSLVELYPQEPIAEKAKTLIDVLGRRKEIEDYLAKLEIKRVEDTIVEVANARPLRPERVGTPLEQDTTRLLPKKLNNLDTNTTGRKPEVKVEGPVVKKDTVKAAVPTAFTFRVEAAHSVIIVMDKVDPVYVTETRNAFNRYNQANYSLRPVEINNQVLNDTTRLVVMSGFDNAAMALDYMKKVQAAAATQIVPWLPAGKYSFLVISGENLEVLKNQQNLAEYRQFHQQYMR
ncbi:MAG: hypothetical protein JNK79_05855, partial [Chitinophagaceae bacterium]|nr:hypothetical protein [Chitinophagaceae bacterium]